MSYVTILGMIAAGVGLMGFALLLAVFTRADGAALLCMLSGTLFTALGGLVLVQQLRRTSLDLRHRPQAATGNEVQA